MKLGLREANQGFSRAMKAVRLGRRVLLTDRGRPFAVITPVPRHDDERTALLAMADAGVISLSRRPGPMPAVAGRPVPVRGAPVSQTIIEDREDRA